MDWIDFGIGLMLGLSVGWGIGILMKKGLSIRLRRYGKIRKQGNFEKEEICSDCARWIDDKCTETTVDVEKSFPNCFIEKDNHYIYGQK
ncbi:hypothetical protein AKJ59_00470 [candidate division MSBL1 archaeon SCGC-AAA385M02]|uniref:Uncharacterized protein n=1 Tax=candidate division MSBL1 archaeon SCGC-AAA385M02 TaxID=1698287 RepID=A0A133VQQ8_9EURY|nr:hypothetical protein AKJ59_00470 [candidate division MSBL1 archaeon SCGC-AAA385M02]